MPDVSFLSEVLIFLCAAVIVGPIFQRLKTSVVLGYLVAGALIGPYALGLLQDDKTTHGLGEIGVVFLLFTIGLELTIDRLRVVRGYIFGLGTAQVGITTVFIFLLAVWAGVPVEPAIVIGGALALSSTAVVLQLMSERGMLSTRVGRIAFSVLLLQDLAVVPLLAIVPALAAPEGSLALTLAWTFLKAGLAVAAIFAVGRLLLRPILRTIAHGRSPELFAAVTLAILLGTSYLTSSFGLSLAIGGFVAGLLLAESEYRHQVEADIAPFRGILLGLFFMTVGMSLDLALIREQAVAVATLVAALVVGKTVLTTLLARVTTGQGWGTSLHVALILGQGGEFAFIVLGLAVTMQLLDPAVGNLLIVSVAITMALTPFLMELGKRIEPLLDRKGVEEEPEAMERDAHDLKDHVIIAGFGRVGQSVGKTLSAADIPYVAVEFEPTRVSEARAQGLPVFYADASRPEVMRSLGADRARAAVVILDNATTAERTVSLLHSEYPQLEVFVRAKDNRHRQRLAEAGATGIVQETFELSLQLAGAVLRRMGTSDQQIQDIILQHRRENYAALTDVIFPIDPNAPTPPSPRDAQGDK